MQKKVRNQMELCDEVNLQLYPLDIIGKRLESLTAEVGKNKTIILDWGELNDLASATFISLRNIRKTLGVEN